MLHETSSYPECLVARFDWKATSDEILAALRSVFGETHPFLLEKDFDDLDDNIAAEGTHDALRAFGQEISAYGVALVSIDEGNDEYCVVLTPFDRHKEAIQAIKKKTKRTAELYKQANRKIGAKARRVDMSKRLRAEEYPMSFEWGERDLDFEPGSRYVLREHRTYAKQGGGKALFSSWLDTATWPPKPHSCSRYVYRFACAPEHALWALLTGRPELAGTPEEYLPSGGQRRDGVVYLTRNPVDEQSWQAVPFPDGTEPTKSRVFFIGDDLFFEQELVVWVLPKAASFRPEEATPHSWHKLFSIEKPEEWFEPDCFPYAVTTGDGTRYIAAGGTIYSWRDGEYARLGCAIRRMRSNWTLPSDKNSFLYVDRQLRLVECDVLDGDERFRSFPHSATYTTLCDIGGGWVAVLASGNPPSSTPIALFWNRESDEWLPLFRGALGRETIMHIEPCAEGTVLIFTHAHRLYRVFDLIGQAKALRGRKAITTYEWSDDPEEGSSLWFYTAMEAELGLTNVRKIEPFGNDEAMFGAEEGIFMVVGAAGLWNKLHAQRKKERPAHRQRVYADGSFVYRVYRMHTPDKLELYRACPSTEQADAGSEPQAKPQEESPAHSFVKRIIARLLLAVARLLRKLSRL